MAKSTILRMADYRAIQRVVGQCRELGDDATLWKRHAVEQLAGLTGGALGSCSELADFRSLRPRFVGMVDWGWGSDSDRQRYYAGHAELITRPEAPATLITYHRRTMRDDGACLSRTELLGDRQWYSTQDYQICHRPVAMDNILWCIRSIPGEAGDESFGVVVLRPRGRRDFGARDRAIVREVQAALTPMIGGPLARFVDPSPMALPPQMRRVLRCVLEGDGDKQIAARMRLSKHTVNQYTKAIFRHFRVRGRAELMARWIRRGWGSTFSWDDHN